MRLDQTLFFPIGPTAPMNQIIELKLLSLTLSQTHTLCFQLTSRTLKHIKVNTCKCIQTHECTQIKSRLQRTKHNILGTKQQLHALLFMDVKNNFENQVHMALQVPQETLKSESVHAQMVKSTLQRRQVAVKIKRCMRFFTMCDTMSRQTGKMESDTQ